MNIQHWRILFFLMIAEVVSGFEASMISSGRPCIAARNIRKRKGVHCHTSIAMRVGSASCGLPKNSVVGSPMERRS